MSKDFISANTLDKIIDDYVKKHNLKSVVKCKDCDFYKGECWCIVWESGVNEKDFCSRAERKKGIDTLPKR